MVIAIGIYANRCGTASRFVFGREGCVVDDYTSDLHEKGATNFPRCAMDFRWVTLIALWTLISGPILGVQTGPAFSKAKPGEKIVRHVVVKSATVR